MIEDDSSPLGSQLLSALREIPADSLAYRSEQRRVQARLAGIVPGLPAAPDGSALAPSTQVVQSASQRVARAAVGAGRRIAVGWLAPAFALGALTGVAAENLYSKRDGRARRETSTHVVESAARSVPTPAASPAPAAPALPGHSDEAAPTEKSLSRPSLAELESTLAGEQALLDAARTALARGEPEVAIAPLQRHATRFQNGKLAEEREALYVRVLAMLKLDDQAAARAAAFHRRFPTSLFSPVVDSAMERISRRSTGGEPKP